MKGDAMKEKIDEFVTNYNIQDLLKLLIEIDTQNPPGNELELAEVILDYYQDKNIISHLYRHQEARATLVIQLDGIKKEQGIAFLGHLDTVPMGNRQDWIRDPLKAIIEDKRMFGLGASDMKGGLVSLLILLSFFLENNIKPMKSLYFIFTADEETGGNGAIYLRETNFLEIHHIEEIIVAEPTNGKVCIGEKGNLWISLEAKGKKAHGAMPEEGINANEMLIKFVEEFTEKINRLDIPNDSEHITVSVTQFHGGYKSNIIPEYANAVLDIRTTNETVHKQIISIAEQIILQMKKIYQVEISYRVQSDKIPLRMDVKDPYVQGLFQIFEKEEYRYNIVPYYTDLAEIMKEKKYPFFIFGPGEQEQMHKTNESIELSSISKIAKELIYYVLSKNDEDVLSTESR